MFTAQEGGDPAAVCAVDDGEQPPPEEPPFDWVQFENLLARDPQRVSPPMVPSAGACPSGAVASILDSGTADLAVLTDAEVVDAVAGFERVIAWAGARQATLLAEFARRRPGIGPHTAGSMPATSRWAPDEIGLALSLSRVTATAKLAQSVQLRDVLADTLAAWETGRLDVLKLRAIC